MLEELDPLLASGCGHPELACLHWPFGASALYAHQEDALRTVEAGRNVIVKTGTGSGKTEAFLLPVLSGVLRLKERGIRGTKAILLYPMNATGQRPVAAPAEPPARLEHGHHVCPLYRRQRDRDVGTRRTACQP